MAVQEVVVNHLWIPEQSGPGSPPHLPVTTSFLPIVMVVCPVGGHQQHDIIWLFHGIDMERDGIQLSSP